MDILRLEHQPDFVPDFIFIGCIDLILITLCGKCHIIHAGCDMFRVKGIFHIGDVYCRPILQTPCRGVRPGFQVCFQCDGFLYFIGFFEKIYRENFFFVFCAGDAA